MAKAISAISANEWMIAMCHKLGYNPARVSRITIDAVPGNPLAISIVTMHPDPNVLDVELPASYDIVQECGGVAI